MLPDSPFYKRWKLCGLLLILAVNLAWLGLGRSQKTVSASEEITQGLEESVEMVEAIAPLPKPSYRTYELPQATVHVVSVPAWRDISIAVADELKTVEDFALETEGAIAIINAGFFDPNNGKTTSYLISEGQNAGDPTENERLTGNPKLQPSTPTNLQPL